MGVQSTKGLNKQINSIVKCPFCNMQLSEKITFQSLNCHIAKCHQKSGANSRESTKNEDSSNDKSQSREKSFEEKQIKLWNKILETKSSRDIYAQKNVIFDKSQSVEEKLNVFSGIDFFDKILFYYRGHKYSNSGMQKSKFIKYSPNNIEKINAECYDAIISDIIKSTSLFTNIHGVHKMNIFEEKNQEITKSLQLLGKIFAKCIIDNVNIKFFFNKIIYKHLVEEQIKFEDLYQIDKDVSRLF